MPPFVCRRTLSVVAAHLRRVVPAAALTALALIAGCTHVGQVEPPVTGLQLAGRVQGGQQPVTGAIIQLYAVGTTGDASPATPLLTQTVFTDALGSFSITGDYKCPSSTALVYLTATQGNPGLATGSTNPNLAMMAALGPCGQLSASTYIWVNEVTTVGTVAALYPYMTGYQTTGSGTADLNAFQTAFSTVSEFANTATGTAPGPTLPSGYYASSTEIDTLGNILAPCINSTGGTAGDGTLCGQLFQLAKPPTGAAPTDTVTAILDILKNPTQNVAALFNLGQAAPPFQPALTSAPSDWTLTIVQVPATPTFSLAAGSYSGPQTLTLADSVANAAIYYTTRRHHPHQILHALRRRDHRLRVRNRQGHRHRRRPVQQRGSFRRLHHQHRVLRRARHHDRLRSRRPADPDHHHHRLGLRHQGPLHRHLQLHQPHRRHQGLPGRLRLRQRHPRHQLLERHTDRPRRLLRSLLRLRAGQQRPTPAQHLQRADGQRPRRMQQHLRRPGGPPPAPPSPPTATPVFSPAGGTYTTTQTVTPHRRHQRRADLLHHRRQHPTTSSSAVYSGPITVASS